MIWVIRKAEGRKVVKPKYGSEMHWEDMHVGHSSLYYLDPSR
jgi:hypothetical protein